MWKVSSSIVLKFKRLLYQSRVWTQKSQMLLHKNFLCEWVIAPVHIQKQELVRITETCCVFVLVVCRILTTHNRGFQHTPADSGLEGVRSPDLVLTRLCLLGWDRIFRRSAKLSTCFRWIIFVGEG